VRPDPLAHSHRRPDPLIPTAAAKAQRRREEALTRRYVASHALGAHLPGTVARQSLVAIYDTAWLLTVLGLIPEETP